MPIPDDISDLSIIRKVSSPEDSFLMLGVVRFANSDCNPNAEYDFSSDHKVVKLRSLRGINPQDEILVKYSEKFFEEYCCLCRTCETLKLQNEVLTPKVVELFTDVVDEEIKKVVINLIDEHQSQILPKVSNSKRKKYSWFQKVRAYSQAYETESPCLQTVVPIPNDSGILSPAESMEAPPVSLFEPETFVPRMSSPLPEFLNDSVDFPSFLSSIGETDTRSVKPLDLPEISQPLYEGAKIGRANTMLLLRAFSSNANLSDVNTLKLHSLVQSLIPENNCLPSGHSLIYQQKKALKETMVAHLQLSDGEICVLSFADFLGNVVGRNLESIFRYSEQKEVGPFNDFYNEKVGPVSRWSDNIEIQLVLSTDGVSFTTSSNISLWPFWLAVANLPPKLRMSERNIAMAALYVGKGKPEWTKIVPVLQTELRRQITVTSHEAVYNVKFDVIAIVADLIAKCNLLNMFQHNGYFGCNYCTIEGVTINRTHAYYPFYQDFQVRDPSINEVFVALAELLNDSAKSITNVCGVKGRSSFDGLVKGLPLSAGIDYMHCVLIGVFEDLLKFHWKGRSAADKLIITSEIHNLQSPIEVTIHCRNIRDLPQMGQFKASEFFNYLFFIAPIIFKGRLPEKHYKHLLQLSVAIRILLESSAERDIDIAEAILNDFCSSLVEIVQSDTAETINVHCLRHLAHQCRSFGPLFVFSAMSFESANRIFKRCFTGTHSHCLVICRRYLEAQSLSSALPEDDMATDLVREWCRQKNPSSSKNFCRDFVTSTDSEYALQLFPDATFLSRAEIDGIYFDSLSYRRCPTGPNSYIRYKVGSSALFGQCLFFIVMSEDSLMGGVTFAQIRKIKVLDKIIVEKKPDSEYFFEIEVTDSQDMIEATSFDKMFYLSANGLNYLVSVPQFLDHK